MASTSTTPFFLRQPESAGPIASLEDGTLPAVLFLDNGGDSIKAMHLPARQRSASTSAQPPLVTSGPPPRFLAVPNCVGFSSVGGDDIVGAHIRELPHFHGFVVRRPVADGFVVDGNRQAQVWEYVLQAFHISAEDEARTQVWLTLPHGAPPEVARALKELLSGRFAFHSVVFVSATFLSLLACEHVASLSASSVAQAAADGTEDLGSGPCAAESAATQGAQTGRRRSRTEVKVETPAPEESVCVPGSPPSAVAKGCGVVVDVGFSSTTIVPYLNYFPVLSSLVRMDVGGKLLTNRLKEHLSFTQTNLLQDGWLVNHIKETCCRVFLDRSKALEEKAEAKLPYYLPTIPALYPLGCREDELDARLGVAPRRGRQARGRRRRTEAVANATVNEDLEASSSSDADEETSPSDTGRAGHVAATASTVDRRVLPVLQLDRERDYIPGLLFTPVNTGVQQAGLVACILHAAAERGLAGQLPLLRSVLLRHVCVFGGSSAFPGFTDRLARELTEATPALDKTEDEKRKGGAPRFTLPPSPPQLSTAVGAFLREKGKNGILYRVEGLPDIHGEGLGTVVSTAAALQPLCGAVWLLATAAGAATRDVVEQRSLCLLQGPQEALLSEMHEAMERML